MKTSSAVRTYLLIPFCSVSLGVFAQPALSKFEAGANAITFIYQGDLAPSKLGSFKTTEPGLGIFGIYKLNNTLYLKTDLAFGKLNGDDSKYKNPAWRQKRNLKFETPVTEITLTIVRNILPPASKEGPRLSPYMSAGMGYTFLHVQRDYSNYNVAFFGQESVVTTGLTADTAHTLPGACLFFRLLSVYVTQLQKIFL